MNVLNLLTSVGNWLILFLLILQDRMVSYPQKWTSSDRAAGALCAVMKNDPFCHRLQKDSRMRSFLCHYGSCNSTIKHKTQASIGWIHCYLCIVTLRRVGSNRGKPYHVKCCFPLRSIMTLNSVLLLNFWHLINYPTSDSIDCWVSPLKSSWLWSHESAFSHHCRVEAIFRSTSPLFREFLHCRSLVTRWIIMSGTRRRDSV